MFKWNQRDASAPTPRADFIVCWIKDLLHPDVSQTTTCLHDKEGFCCLGVASNTAGYQWVWAKDSYVIKIPKGKQYSGTLPYDLSKFLKTYSPKGLFNAEISISSQHFYDLADANDEGISFKLIAKAIQDYCTLLFKDLSTKEIDFIQSYKIPTE